MTSTPVACPYPGAVPLSADQHRLLVGRTRDIADLTRFVQTKQIITLTAPSGVGKTSLLRAGLFKELDGRGYVVAPFAEWSKLTAAEDPWDRLVIAVKGGLESAGLWDPGDQESPEPTEFLEGLERRFGGTLVLVFDQLEEVFRLDPHLGDQLLLAIMNLVAPPDGGPPFPFKFVLSLRSEFRDSVGTLENGLAESYWQAYRLAPVSDDAIPHLVTQPLEGTGVEISDDDARRFVKLWEAGAGTAIYDDESSRGSIRLGLLHMQALLWVLWHQVQPKAGQLLSWDVLNKQDVLKTDKDLSRGGSVEIFEHAIDKYVELRLEQIESEFPDARIGVETRIAGARLVPYLSSGSYKQIWDSADLIWRAEADSLDLLMRSLSPRAGEDSRSLVRALVRSSLIHSADLYRAATLPAEQASSRLLELAGYGSDPRVSESDHEHVSAGRVRGRSTLSVLAEVVANHGRSLVWLADAMLIRITPDVDNRTSISVTHDGFGPALSGWGDAKLQELDAALASLVQVAGEPLVFSEEKMSHGLVKDLVWWGGAISGRIISTEFRDCDLRGTVFSNCHLENVRFVNCNLRGVLFRMPTIAGDEGLDFTVESPSAHQEVEVNSLTLLQVDAVNQAPLMFRGLSGVGLFIELSTSSPVTLDRVDLQHVNLAAGRESDEGCLEIRGGKVSHLVVSSESAFRVETSNEPELKFAEYGPLVQGAQAASDGG